MSTQNFQFPSVTKTLADFIHEEEGNIPRSTMLTIGTMLLLLSVFYANDAFSAHKSHSSHSSHKSHTSHTSHTSSQHSSHISHSNSGGCDTGTGVLGLGLIPAVFKRK